MTELTPDKSNELCYLERQADRIRNRTKEITLVEGPFHGLKARIAEYFPYFRTTIPEDVAKNFRPLEFDGIPDVPEDLIFVAVYDQSNSNQYIFKEVQVWKQTSHKSFPLGHEQLQV